MSARQIPGDGIPAAVVDELNAWARRAGSANGFGDCACVTAVGPSRAVPSAPPIDDHTRKECEP